MYIDSLKKQINYWFVKYKIKRSFPFLFFATDKIITCRHAKSDVEFFIFSSVIQLIARNKTINLTYLYQESPNPFSLYYFKIFQFYSIHEYDVRAYCDFLISGKALDEDSDIPKILRIDLGDGYDLDNIDMCLTIQPDVVVLSFSSNQSSMRWTQLGKCLNKKGYVFDWIWELNVGLFIKLESVNGFPSSIVSDRGLSKLLPLACPPKKGEFRWPT